MRQKEKEIFIKLAFECFKWWKFRLTEQYHMFIGLKTWRAMNPIFDAGAMPCICKWLMLVNGGQWKPYETSSIFTFFVLNKLRSSFCISRTKKNPSKKLGFKFSSNLWQKLTQKNEDNHRAHTQIFVVRCAGTNIGHMIFRYRQIVVVRCRPNIFENHNMLIGEFNDCFWTFASHDITKDTRFHGRHDWTKFDSIQMMANFLQL